MFSELGAGNNKKKDYCRLWYQNMMEVGAYFEQNTESNIYCDQTDTLQKIIANIIISILIKVYIKIGCNS